MSKNQGLNNRPIHIKSNFDEDNVFKRIWYYEENKGMNIVYEIWVEDKYIRTVQMLIPRNKVNVYIRNCEELK